MIALNSTWNTVVMLLVAGGVGLIGGLGAALIEWRTRSAASPSPAGDGVAAPSASGSYGALNVFACVVLGGIAAIAVLYFFPPTKEVVEPAVDGGESVTKTFYDLIKLVALSLIVGSAGTVFLQSLQARTLNLANEQRADAAEAKTGAAVKLADRVPDRAETSINATLPQVKETLQKAGLTPGDASVAAEKVVEQTSSAVMSAIQPQVDAVKVAATTGPATTPPASPSETPQPA